VTIGEESSSNDDCKVLVRPSPNRLLARCRSGARLAYSHLREREGGDNMARQRTVVPLRKQQHQEREPIVYSGFRLEERALTPVGTPTREQWSTCLDYLMHL